MNKKGFTLIELLIVIAIISILVGVAVPYYNDYIIDSRKSVLQSNLATIRKAINQFRADNQRGPARVNITTSNPSASVNGLSNPFDELVNGPLQRINNQWARRSNLKYLNTFPDLVDPNTGLQILATSAASVGKGQYYIEFVRGNCFYNSGNEGSFNTETNFAFVDTDGNGAYDVYDVRPFNISVPSATPILPLDYIDINIVEKKD